MSAPTFRGTAEQQTLAAEVFRLMTSQGAMFAADTPIKQTLSNLADFLAMQQSRERDVLAQEIDTALQQNDAIFRRHEADDDIVYMTSRSGTHEARRDDVSHTFRQRLYEPEDPLPIDDISVVVSTSRPALTTVEPVFISDYWQQQAGLIPIPPSEDDADAMADDLSSMPVDMPPARVEEGTVDAFAPTFAPTDVPADIAEDVSEMPTPVEAEPWLEPQPVEEEELVSHDLLDDVTPSVEPPVVAVIPDEILPPAEELPVPEELGVSPDEEEVEIAALADADAVVIDEADEAVEPELVAEPEDTGMLEPVMSSGSAEFTLADGTVVNLAASVSQLMAAQGEKLKDALLASIDQDPLQRIVRFGHLLFTDADKVNLGKNDMRRIRDYIIEVGEPLLDTTIIADLYYHSQRQTSSESFRFSLNYRLSREKDFEFVGVEGAYLWSARGLPAIGTKRVKASEMGQLTSYVVEGFDESLTTQDAATIVQTGSIHRVLSFFEWDYGILPFDASMAALFPRPLLADQRSVVLRIESPQHYTAYPIEIRYPTGNRGGWLQGLDDFFHEHLVAGALITIARTDEPNVFTISYNETPVEEDRILTFDEKKNKFAFANIGYACAVDADQFLSQQKYGKFKNLKALPTSDRRKGDLVLAHVFQVVGEQLGSRAEPLFWITLDDLFVAYNVLRPASRPYLVSLLEGDESYNPDDATPGAYYYKPEPDEEGEEEEDEDEGLLIYDDDDEY